MIRVAYRYGHEEFNQMVLNQIVEFLIADVGGDPSSIADVMALIEKFSSAERMFVVFDEFQEVKKLDAGD